MCFLFQYVSFEAAAQIKKLIISRTSKEHQKSIVILDNSIHPLDYDFLVLAVSFKKTNSCERFVVVDPFFDNN